MRSLSRPTSKPPKARKAMGKILPLINFSSRRISKMVRPSPPNSPAQTPKHSSSRASSRSWPTRRSPVSISCAMSN
jgi:hypothetical protein